MTMMAARSAARSRDRQDACSALGKRLCGDLVPGEREQEIYRLWTVEGFTLREIGERFGIGPERVRQLLKFYFRESGMPLAVRERRAHKRAVRIAAVSARLKHPTRGSGRRADRCLASAATRASTARCGPTGRRVRSSSGFASRSRAH
jgi:hypothetical protein